MLSSRPILLCWLLVMLLAGVGASAARASEEEATPGEVEADSSPGLPWFKAVTSAGTAVVGSVATIVEQVTKKEEEPAPVNVIYVRLSKSFLEKHLCKQFDQTAPVRDVILGAAVSGTSRTTARTELELVPNPKEAQARLLFRGESAFQTISRSGPVQIHSRGVMRFVSEKRLWFDGINVRQTPPVTKAETETTTLDITTGLGRIARRVVLRIAARQEAASHREAEAITTQRTTRKVERAFDEVVHEYADAFCKDLKAQYAQLPTDGFFAIGEIRSSTTPHMLQVAVLRRGDQPSALADAPPVSANQADIEIHIHRAMIPRALRSAGMRDAIGLAVTDFIDTSLGAIDTEAPCRACLLKQDAGQRPEVKADKWMSFAWLMTPTPAVRQAAARSAAVVR